MDIVIIEDEWLLADELEQTLESMSNDYKVVAKLQSIEDSVDWLKVNNCDLIFMDIQLSDGLSFSIFDKVGFLTPVIFTTSYDQYAIKAFELNSIAYILKPLDESDISKAIFKYKQLEENYISNLRRLVDDIGIPEPLYKQQLILSQGPLKKIVKIEQIMFFEADDRYVQASLDDTKKMFCPYSLKELEEILDPLLFFRINRSYIITGNSSLIGSPTIGER